MNAGCWPLLKTMSIALVVALVTVAIAAFGLSRAQELECWDDEPSMAPGYMQWPSPPNLVIDPSETYTATLDTNRGTIVIELFSSQAPNTVNNFVCLSLAGYYDVTVFHRIMFDFMIQGGDPTGTGGGGPGYSFADELPEGTAPYTRGTIAMANAGPDTNGSQFFIVHASQPEGFPNNYSIFGRVISGLDVLDTIASAPVTFSQRGEESSPLATLGIKSITIRDSSGAVFGQATDAATPEAPAAPPATEAPVATPDESNDEDSQWAVWLALAAAVVAGAGYYVWSQGRRSASAAKTRKK